MDDLVEQYMSTELKLMRRDGNWSRSFKDEEPQFLSLVLLWSDAMPQVLRTLVSDIFSLFFPSPVLKLPEICL